MDESQQALLIAEQTKLQASIRFYEQALLNHDVLLSLLTAEFDLASYELTTLEAKTKAWEEFAQKGRQLEASSARMDAEVAKKAAPDLPKAIKEQNDIAEQNPEIVDRVKEIIEKEHTPSFNPRWQFQSIDNPQQ